MNFFKQTQPFIVPTTDGKLIAEHFGVASTQQSDVSIAYMEAPPKWSEPHQTPLFDEYTLMLSGKKSIWVNDEQIILKKGESLLVKAGCRVKYENPYDEPAKYISICKPAFSIETVGREDNK